MKQGKSPFLSFQEWQRIQIDDMEDDAVVVCPVCHGDGEVTEECECCGHESERECEICEGTGRVVFGELSECNQRRCFNLWLYRKELHLDVLKLADFCGNPLKIVKHGFAISCNIQTHDLEVVTL